MDSDQIQLILKNDGEIQIEILKDKINCVKFK